MISTACPLDCWDACGIVCDPARPDKLAAAPSHPGYNGTLCVHLNKHIHMTDRITEPMIDGKPVSMDEALDAAADAFKAESKLMWRGSGNLGFMQSVTNLLMERIGGVLISGGLCDSAGQAGIEAGRGYHRQLPLEQIKKAEVVVVWGRNLTVTNKHVLPLIEDKKIIVIDPVHTEIAKRADLFLQIKPRSDIYLAILLARLAIMEGSEDTGWLEEFAPEWEEFYEFTQEFRIKAILEYMGLGLDMLGDMLYMIKNHKTVFMVGIGPQHYTIGHSVLWAIDSLAAVLGLFGKEGCGVDYMGISLNGFEYPFETSCPRVPAVDTPFDKFETVLVRGGNPAESMPDSNTVTERLKKVKNLIYFGLYENETSSLSRIVIPAKNFLEKDDLRLSYGHYCVQPMKKVLDGSYGISEYDFVSEVLKRLGLEGLDSESSYINRMLDQCDEVRGQYISPDYASLPYNDGFGEDGGDEFEFIDEFDDEFEPVQLRKFRKPKSEKFDGVYWLITPKAISSLNTQFKRRSFVLVPPEAGVAEGERVRIKSDWGEIELEARISDDLRYDCVLIYNSTPGVNRLTPPYISEEGGGACYGEARVRLERL